MLPPRAESRREEASEMIQRLPRALLACASLSLTSLPAAAQDTLVGLGAVHGYTGSVYDTTKAQFDILVDASQPEDAQNGRYRTVQAAYAAARSGTAARPTVIGLKPDVYRLHGSATDTGLHITKPYITLIGLTRDRRSVVLADNRGNKQGASNNGFTIMVDAEGFSAINLTVVNFCNLDYDYPGDAAKSLRKRSDVITQAVAIQMRGDRHVYSHVAFLSRLDTMFNMTARSYFDHVYLEGTDDYLGAPGASVWSDSEINFIEGGGILFAGGTTFIRTRFRATRPMQFYKVQVAPVTLIDTILPDVPIAWFGWRAPVTGEPSRIWRVRTETGRPVTIADSVMGRPAYTLTHELTDEQARAFSPYNLLRWNAHGSDDGWDPAGVRIETERVGILPTRVQLQPEHLLLRTGEPAATLTARLTPASTGGVRWTTPSHMVTLAPSEGERVTVTAANHTERRLVVPIEAHADNGLASRAYVTVDPPYRPAPTIVGKPTIRRMTNGHLTAHYALSPLGRRHDRSLVTWYLCGNAGCTDRQTIAVSRGDVPLKTLAVSPGLSGRYLMVGVQPQHDLSKSGLEVRSGAVGLPAVGISTASATADFRSMPDSATADRWQGAWHSTGSWSAEAPLDGAQAWGFRVGGDDSSLMYVGRPRAGDMDVEVMLDPDKLEGQGFAIAGSPGDDARPRAEVKFKYDSLTRSGYALRFWRSTRSATAVVFQLYRIDHGKGIPLGSADQLTGVLKPTTTLHVRVRGTRVSVNGSNTADGQTLALSGTIIPNAYGGAGFYWTGSTLRGRLPLTSTTTIAPLSVTSDKPDVPKPC
jgi:hypothetical protein